MAKEKLYSAQVLRAAVNQRGFRPSHRVRAVIRGVKAEFFDPTFDDSGVLARSEVRRIVNAAWEHIVLGLQSRDLDPFLNGVTSRGRDFELDRTLGLVLHDDRPRCHLIAVANVPDLECNEVTSAELAVNSQVEQREFAYPVLHLETDSECPDILCLERRLLADDLALVPWLAMNGIGYGSHDGLPSS